LVSNLAAMEVFVIVVVIVVIYLAMPAFVLVMFWRLIRAIERIADKLDQE